MQSESLKVPDISLIELLIDKVERTASGFECYCVHPLLEEYQMRTVTDDQFLTHMDADKNGMISIINNNQNCDGEIVETEQLLTLEEWLDDHSAIDLDVELKILINRRESRTIYIRNQSKPTGLADLSSVLNSFKPRWAIG